MCEITIDDSQGKRWAIEVAPHRADSVLELMRKQGFMLIETDQDAMTNLMHPFTAPQRKIDAEWRRFWMRRQNTIIVSLFVGAVLGFALCYSFVH